MNNYEEISPLEIQGNPFKMIGKDWMLITGGTQNNCNTMTASWGGFGELWFKPVVFIFIRPQRHTLPFINDKDFFTLSFLDETYKDKLTFCGRNSGKNTNKIEKCGFTKVETHNKAIGFEQANLVLECKKLYSDTIKEENFIDQNALEHYPNKDYHLMFVAEITRVYKKQ